MFFFSSYSLIFLHDSYIYDIFRKVYHKIQQIKCAFIDIITSKQNLFIYMYFDIINIILRDMIFQNNLMFLQSSIICCVVSSI